MTDKTRNNRGNRDNMGRRNDTGRDDTGRKKEYKDRDQKQ
jgi:hypothetical protein